MNRFIFIIMLFCVSLLAREEMFLTQKYPTLHHMEHTQHTHDVDLERRLELER